MYGLVKIEIVVRRESRDRFVTVFRKTCKREDADEAVRQFKESNRYLEPVICQITWQPDREYL